MSIYYIDCEFDGHNGPLISMALIGEEDDIYIVTDYDTPQDPWVVENVMPYIDEHNAERTFTGIKENDVGELLHDMFETLLMVQVIADSPVDLMRFFKALSTNGEGKWRPSELDRVSGHAVNVDAWPCSDKNLTQHNAWCDAKALKIKMREMQS